MCLQTESELSINWMVTFVKILETNLYLCPKIPTFLLTVRIVSAQLVTGDWGDILSWHSTGKARVPGVHIIRFIKANDSISHLWMIVAVLQLTKLVLVNLSCCRPVWDGGKHVQSWHSSKFLIHRLWCQGMEASMCAGHKAPNCNSHSTLWRKPTDGVQSKCSGTLQAYNVFPFIDASRGISCPNGPSLGQWRWQ